MSACNTFTEHVWKPGECKNCFKPKSLHRLAEAGLKNGPQERPVQLQSHTPAAGRPNANVASPYVRSGGSGRPGHFRPPVAKKPTIAVKPTMMLSCSSAGLDSEGNRVTPDAVEAGKMPDFAAWNRNGTNWKRPSGVNNNEGEDGGEEFEGYGPRSCRVPASGNNNGLTEVLKEIAGLGTDLGSSSGSSSRDLFLGRISTSYKRSLERGLPAPSCLAMGSSRGGASHKHVSLSDSTEVISTEGGRFCYPEFSSEGEEEEEESEGDDGGEHESWDESDEELLAMEIRMRGQPRFANFRAATLSPVPFAAGKKWNTVPLRNRSLQRICAVDYDDSYDEILNGYPSVDSNGGFVPFGQHDLQGSGFFSNSESTTSPESSSSAPEDSRTTTSSSTSSAPSHLPNGLHSPSESREPVPDSAAEKESAQRGLRSPKVSETHKAVLAIRLEERDGNQKEGGPLPQALPGQPVTISFSPTEEQAKPYRVVSLEKAPICKPYTVVDVSASMGHTEEHPTDSTSKPKGSSVSSTSSPSSPLGLPLSPTSPVSPTSLTPSALLNASRKKPGNIRYQEVWTSSTSPRQKVPKVELVGGATSGPVVPPRHYSHKSAPTSPTAGLSSSSRTVPVKSPNLSEIKFNSYNNAGMPPFPIIIRDEPTYARGSKNAVKVPIVINPSAYDNLAVYKSFLGVSGEIPPAKTAGSGRVASHTYEEIGSAESTPSSPIETCANGNLISEKVAADEKKVGSVAQKVQELNSGSITVSSMTPSSAAMSSLLLTSPQMGSLAKGTSSAVSQGCFGKVSRDTTPDKVGTSEYQPSTGTGSSHREKASTVLSQIVASIQPPQSPPESPMAQSKTCSAEELYAVPPDATKDTLSRPKSLFSTTDGCLSKPRKDGTSKQLPKSQSSSAAIPPTSPRSEPNAPFPPPRSTSSPYHAANLLQRHFGNWAKPAAGTSRPSEGETSPGGGEGKRAGAESTKPKRWISFKSFFRRRKDEDEQRERTEREKEKGKLLGLDGTVIHMLPPPPIQRHHWFTEAKADDPSQKPTIIFTYKPEAEASMDGEEGQQLHVEELRGTLQLTHEQTGKQLKSGTSLVTRDISMVTAQGTEGHAPTTASLSAMLEMSPHTEPRGAAVTQLLGEGAAGPGEPDDNSVHFPSRSHSPASSTCSATYSNLGQSRANMIPLKQPRNPKASDDTLPTGDPEGSDGGPKATPPPLPKKNVARANTEPSALGRELLAPRPKGEAKPGGSNLSVANPLYDLDSTWETASQGSSMGSEARPPDQESGDSLERPAAGKGRPATSLSCMTSPATVSAGRQPKRGCRSVESLSGRGRGGTRSQRVGLYKGMDNWEEVLGRIRGLHTDTLRKLACRCEDRFMAGQKDPLRFGTDSWSDFRLTTGRCCEAGDAVYYTASYAKDPLVNYAVKICRSQVKETQQQLFHSLAVRQSLAPHFNIQQDCGHFLADVPLRLLPWEEDDQGEEEEEEEERKEACENNERVAKRRDAADGASSPGQPKHTISAGRLRSRVVVITREVPFQTVADFVQQGAERHTHSPDLYERQVCLLLLQLCQGLEHMKPYHVTHCDLRLENLLLVHCQPGNPWNLDMPEPNNNNDGSGSASGSGCPARLIISNFSQAKQKSPLAEPGTLREQARLAPEIVTATQYRKCDEFQTGILIYEMLHRPNPFEETPELKETEYTCADLPPLPVRSLYSRGLQRLASLLLDANPSERIQISDARACLQCLLWGPREDLFQALAACPGPAHRDAALQNWLDLKRTLMMIKFAERSLDSASGVSLEDWLCCQYLSSASTDSLARVVRILQPMQPQPQQL